MSEGRRKRLPSWTGAVGFISLGTALAAGGLGIMLWVTTQDSAQLDSHPVALFGAFLLIVGVGLDIITIWDSISTWYYSRRYPRA